MYLQLRHRIVSILLIRRVTYFQQLDFTVFHLELDYGGIVYMRNMNYIQNKHGLCNGWGSMAELSTIFYLYVVW